MVMRDADAVARLAKMVWTARSTNVKTGDVPQVWIGATADETAASCAGCPMRPKREGGNGDCYARSGTPAIAHSSALKGAAKRPERYTLDGALARAARAATMVRFGANGDPGRAAGVRDAIREVTRRGLRVVGYTHHWRDDDVEARVGGSFLASCDTLADADAAHDAGWRAAVVLDADADRFPTFTTPAGRTGIVCPATRPGSTATCATCLICADPSPNRAPVGFPNHSQRVHAERRRNR